MLRSFAWAGLALLVASCDALPALTGAGRDPVRALTLMEGDVVVAAPSGYCIDQSSSRPARGFVVMAGCALVSNDPSMPAEEGLVTMQVGGAETALVAADEQALRDLLTTVQGAAVLSPNGNPASIRIDQLESGDGVVYVHFVDSAPPPVAGLEQAEWRAFFDIGTRLATVTVRGFERSPLETEPGLRLLRRAVATIRDASDS